MTSDAHTDVGAYVLGALDADERAAFEAHLASCERCRSELVDFAPLPGLLAAVDVTEIAVASPTSVSVYVDAAKMHVLRLTRSRQRWRFATTMLVTAAMVLAAVLITTRTGEEPRFDRGSPIEFTLASNAFLDGRVAVDERLWGSRIEVDLLGLPAGETFEIWVVGDDDAWELAASFGPTPNGTCRIVGSTTMRPDHIAQVVITTSHRGQELLWASASS